MNYQSTEYETKISNVITLQKNFGGRFKWPTFEFTQILKK